MRAALLGTAPKATALTATRRLDLRALEREHARLVPGMPVAELEDFGERLAELLLPEEIAAAPALGEAAPLVVVHDTRERALALGGAQHQGLGARRRSRTQPALRGRRHVGRQVARAAPPRARVQRAAGHQPDRRPAGRGRGRRTRRADARAASRAPASRRSAATRRRARGCSPSSAPATTTRSTSPATPSSTPPRPPRAASCAPAAACCRAPTSRRWTPCRRSCSSMPANPGACAAAVNPLRQLDRSVGFAEAFLRGGVANFIGTWWPVSDAARHAPSRHRCIANWRRAARSASRSMPRAPRCANCPPPTGPITCTTAAIDFALKVGR